MDGCRILLFCSNMPHLLQRNFAALTFKSFMCAFFSLFSPKLRPPFIPNGTISRECLTCYWLACMCFSIQPLFKDSFELSLSWLSRRYLMRTSLMHNSVTQLDVLWSWVVFKLCMNECVNVANIFFWIYKLDKN